MHGDRRITANDLNPVDISLRQNLLMAVAGRRRVIVVLVAHERQGCDPGGTFVTGVIVRRRQRHKRRYVRLHPLGDCGGMAAQPCLTALGAGIEEPGVERIVTFRYRQWRHEIAPDIADQTFHLALVVSFPRPLETVVEQVMTLQLSKHLRAQAPSAFHDLGHRKPSVMGWTLPAFLPPSWLDEGGKHVT